MSEIHNDVLLVHRIILDPDVYEEHEYYRKESFFFNEYIDGHAGIDPEGLRLAIQNSGLLTHVVAQLDEVDPSYLKEPYDEFMMLEGEQLLSIILMRTRHFAARLHQELGESTLITREDLCTWARQEIEELEDALCHLFILEILQYCKDHDMQVYHPLDPHFTTTRKLIVDHDLVTSWKLNDPVTMDACNKEITRMTNTYSLPVFEFDYANSAYHQRSIPISVSNPIYPLAPYLRCMTSYVLYSGYELQDVTGTYYIMNHRNQMLQKSLITMNFKPNGKEDCYLMYNSGLCSVTVGDNLSFALAQSSVYHLMLKHTLNPDQLIQVFGQRVALDTDLP